MLNFFSIPVYMLLTLLTFFQEFKSLVSSTQIELEDEKKKQKKLLLLLFNFLEEEGCVCVYIKQITSSSL